MQKDKFIVLLLLIASAGCGNNDTGKPSRMTEVKKIESDIVNYSEIKHSSSIDSKCDTTITYDLDDISSEGAEVQGCYVSRYLVRAKMSIYGSVGQSSVLYLFDGDTVHVTENNYTYGRPLREVKGATDMRLTDSTAYGLSIKTKKIIEGKGSAQSIDIFKKLIDNIPLELK
ncbi:MAG: hypothetical protein J7497_05290 [Chitinophagaceae bacterium]|nr:hypothetical protein [Chitinophagaceae bacterium]